MHFLQAINSDLSVLIVCNKTGGTIKGDIKKNVYEAFYQVFVGGVRRRKASVTFCCSRSLLTDSSCLCMSAGGITVNVRKTKYRI